MRAIFSEIFDLFKTQKIYLFLLLGIFLFYGVFFFARERIQAKPVLDQKIEKYENLLKQSPDNAEMLKKKLEGRPDLRVMIEVFTFFFALAFGYGVWLGIKDMRGLFHKQELIPRSDHQNMITWGVQEIVKVVILFFSLGICLNIVFLVVHFFKPSVPPAQYILIHTLILDSTVVAFLVYLVKNTGSRFSDLFGFDMHKIPLEEVWWGIRTYFVILPIFICLLLLLVLIASLMSYEPPPHPLVEVLLEEDKLSAVTIVLSLLIACIVGPVVEEIFFRGFFYPAIRKYVGVFWGMLITALLFAGVHENIFSFIPIFFLGLSLGYLYEKRANLLSCISLHLVHNTAFITYFFLLKSVLGEALK